MRHALLTGLLCVSLLAPASLRADEAAYRYDGAHAQVADGVAGFCYEEGLHEHESAPADRTAFNTVAGVRHYIGDPVSAGADPERVQIYRFHGTHPIPRAIGGGICGLEGLHHHTWPPATLSVGTWRWEDGAWAWGYDPTPAGAARGRTDSSEAATRYELLCPSHYPRAAPGTPATVPSAPVAAGTPIDLPTLDAPAEAAPEEEEYDLPRVREPALMPISTRPWLSRPGWPVLPITSKADIEHEEMLVRAEVLASRAGHADEEAAGHAEHPYDAPVVHTWGMTSAGSTRSTRSHSDSSGDGYDRDSPSSSSSGSSRSSSSGDSSGAKSAWSGKGSGGRDHDASASSSRYGSKKR